MRGDGLSRVMHCKGRYLKVEFQFDFIVGLPGIESYCLK